MTGKTHVACGTAVAIALTIAQPGYVSIMGYNYMPALSIATVATGSLLPDIDIGRSSMGQKHSIISKFLTHRGITHTMLAPMFLLWSMNRLSEWHIPILPSLILGLVIGWVAHIVADMFNSTGVPILWPIVNKKISLASFKTSSWHEVVFMTLWIGVLVLCLALTKYMGTSLQYLKFL